ncbi:alanine racemase [Ornithinicoccus halotolerans]|uniref:alanine racemase n=1 Tax=Ornithinicoccus halotolerans TaxID=1748220 RepID=UPI0012973FBB|nr:alanine racemase [Ornithinicoccus halotolerans]
MSPVDALPTPPGDYPAVAVVDLDAIAGNVATLREHAGGSPLMAVVKADAYGHGLLPSARAALRGGASWLGVAQLSEAFRLREGGVTAPVLAWMLTPDSDYRGALRHDVELGVSAPWALEAAAAAAREEDRVARVQLKADTGLGRNGAYALPVPGGPGRTDWAALVDTATRLEAEGTIRVTGLFSHFAAADAPQHPTVSQQQRTFADAVALAERAGLRPELRHLANSAATLTTPGARWDMVRPGVAVYGLTPAPDVGSSADFGLVPAMTVLALASVVKRVAAGQGVSYGHTYTTPAETTLVDIPIGYADGVPRHVSNSAEVLAGGRRHRIAGRVCMDQFVIDVADTPVAAGDRLVLFGPGRAGEPTAQEWAEAAGTINYEIVSRFGPRVPRRYVGEDVAPGTEGDQR